MIQKTISCFKCVDGELVKNGKAASGKQRFLCKSCKRTQIINYTYKACLTNTNSSIVLLTKEGVGIRSTARLLLISTTTLLKRIVIIAYAIAIHKGGCLRVILHQINSQLIQFHNSFLEI